MTNMRVYIYIAGSINTTFITYLYAAIKRMQLIYSFKIKCPNDHYAHSKLHLRLLFTIPCTIRM